MTKLSTNSGLMGGSFETVWKSMDKKSVQRNKYICG